MLLSALNVQKFPQYFSAIVLLVLTLFPVAVFAQLAPAEREELNTLLLKARDVNTALQSRVQCYTDKDKGFQSQSSQLQQQAGELHQQEQHASAELQRVKAEAEGFRLQLQQARQMLAQSQDRMTQVEAQIRGRQAALDKCKDDWGFMGFLCDFAGELSGLNSQLRQLSAERQAHELTANSLVQHFQAAENRQRQAEQLLQDAQSKLDQTQAQLAVTEDRIKLLKLSLEEIRAVRQQYTTQHKSFSLSFEEFESLDPASDRRSVTRRLRQESTVLSEVLIKAQSLLDKNGLQLPGGGRICAV